MALMRRENLVRREFDAGGRWRRRDVRNPAFRWAFWTKL